jgi:hypothetical protein
MENNLGLTEREEKTVDKKLISFVECVNDLQTQKEQLCLEVLELRAAKSEIINEIKKTVPSTTVIIEKIKEDLPVLFNNFSKNLDQAICSRVEARLKEVSDESMQSIVMIKTKTEELKLYLDEAIQRHKSFLLYKGVITYLVCFFSALIMAVTLYYFFPQKITIHNELGADDIQALLIGEATLQSWKKLDGSLKKDILEIYRNEHLKHRKGSLK